MKPTVEESIGTAATKIATEIEANCIISIKRYIRDNKEVYASLHYNEMKVDIFKKIKDSYKRYEYITEVSRFQISPIIFIKRLLIKAINQGYVEKGDRIVFIEDSNVTPAFKGALYVFDANKLFLNIGETHKSLEGIDINVMESIIDIALELSEEGREGKNIGTAFIITVNTPINKYTKQLVLNPFEKEEKNIKDHEIKESIKEFSQLDGVFIINKDGKIISTGTYIDINSDNINLPMGLGTRHRNCAALTKETDAIAIVVSESGGIVRIFKNGQMIMRFP